MKLWSSFIKELTIASRGFYFYVEIAMAAVLLVVILFVVPEEFVSKENVYLYVGFPSAQMEEYLMDEIVGNEADVSETSIKIKKEEYPATLFESEAERVYLFENREDMIEVAKAKHKLGAAIVVDENLKFDVTYYTQGNETEKYINLLKMMLQGMDDEAVYSKVEMQEVKTISTDYVELTDRENLLPVFLTFNGSLMGLFIMAAYIFLDKKEGVIKAYAITPSPVWKYLLSKMLMLTATALVTSLIITVPVMGGRINYLLMILLLITTGLFASALGLLLAGYFSDMNKSFGVMYLLIIGIMLPALAYYVPSWDPLWLKFVPSYYIVYGFKEIFIKGDTPFILLIALGYLVASILLFGWANMRYRRTLSV
jgi:ABC-2 type transport system permease protein